MKLKAITAAVLLTMSVGAFAAAPSSFEILSSTTNASMSSKTFSGSIGWNYSDAFDLNLNLFGTGTPSYSWTLTGPEGSDSDSFSNLNSSSFNASYGWQNLVAGAYTFAYSGAAAKFSSAGISLTSSIAPMAPVPEPETYAMLLAGLGMMGAIARRRKSKQA